MRLRNLGHLYRVVVPPQTDARLASERANNLVWRSRGKYTAMSKPYAWNGATSKNRRLRKQLDAEWEKDQS
jgi:hypothetical protein